MVLAVNLFRLLELKDIIVDKKHVIIAGHTRFYALQELGVKQIQVVVRDLPPKLAREYRLADNKISELAVWDTPKLLMELAEIPDAQALAVFFPGDSLNTLLAQSNPADIVRDVETTDIHCGRTKPAGAVRQTRRKQSVRHDSRHLPILSPNLHA